MRVASPAVLHEYFYRQNCRLNAQTLAIVYLNVTATFYLHELFYMYIFTIMSNPLIHVRTCAGIIYTY